METFGGGLAQGLQSGLSIGNSINDSRWVRSQRERAAKEQARVDQEREGVREAHAEAWRALHPDPAPSLADAQATQLPADQAGPSMPMPQNQAAAAQPEPNQSSNPSLSGPITPTKPAQGGRMGGFDDDQTYRYYTTLTDSLARRNLMDSPAFQSAFQAQAAVGTRLRQQALGNIMGELEQGNGDAIAKAYSYLNNGKDIKQVTPVPDANQSAWQVSGIDRLTGKPFSATVTKDTIARSVQWAADPANALKAELEYSAKVREEQGKQAAIGAREKDVENLKSNNSLKEEDAKQKNRVSLEGVKGNEDRKSIGARGDQERKTKQTPGAGYELDANGNPVTKAEATDKTKSERMHGLVKDVMGEQQNGPLGGTRIGGQDTLNTAAYAEALQKANPGMSDLQAARAAVAEFVKRKPGGAK